MFLRSARGDTDMKDPDPEKDPGRNPAGSGTPVYKSAGAQRTCLQIIVKAFNAPFPSFKFFATAYLSISAHSKLSEDAELCLKGTQA